MLNLDDRLIKEVSPKIKPNALSTLLAIAIHLNKKTGRSFPSHKRLMQLTGLGRDAVYAALEVLKNKELLLCEQAIDKETGRFGKRTFKVTTRFIQIFVAAEDAEPLTENPDTDYPDTDDPLTDDPETELLNNKERLNKTEQLKNPEQLKKEFPAAAAPDTVTPDFKGENRSVKDGKSAADLPGRGGHGTRGIGQGIAGGQGEKRGGISDGKENTATVSWSRRVAAIFDEVHASQCKAEHLPCQPFNWKVCQEENFRQLKNLKEQAILPDYRNKFHHDPNDEELDVTFRAFFTLAWNYFRKIQKDKKGALHYTPTSIYKQYNAIKTFKQNGSDIIITGQQEPSGAVFGQGIDHFSK